LKIPPRSYHSPRLSPDGKHVAYTVEDGKEANIWIYDIGGTAAPRQLTVGGSNRYPVWSANGDRVAFQSDREGDLGIFWQPADGGGTADRLTKPEQGVAHVPDSSSPNGEMLSFTAIKGNEGAVWILALKDKKATIFAQTPSALVAFSAFSPDGHWLAYESDETKALTYQVWVQPFPNPTGARYPIFQYGQPFWSADGKELFYNAGPGGQMAVVKVTTRPSFAFGVATPLPLGLLNRSPATYPRNYDITRDGKLIGVINSERGQAGTAAGSEIEVVLNWFSELQQLFR
jgi:Tol biopolymer transport system component